MTKTIENQLLAAAAVKSDRCHCDASLISAVMWAYGRSSTAGQCMRPGLQRWAVKINLIKSPGFHEYGTTSPREKEELKEARSIGPRRTESRRKTCASILEPRLLLLLLLLLLLADISDATSIADGSCVDSIFREIYSRSDDMIFLFAIGPKTGNKSMCQTRVAYALAGSVDGGYCPCVENSTNGAIIRHLSMNKR
jgi:hypothetical protein